MDYRTEVFGLMRAQLTKNAVIVPEGAKGGFILKRPPADRDELTAEVERQYVAYIRGLLDLTDNLVDGEVRHPDRVRVLDDPDTYLVVAADKGTATLSDTANRVREERGFWLGDAFASGGRTGYDHKALGITARGAWESVKRHLSELDLDPAPTCSPSSGSATCPATCSATGCCSRSGCGWWPPTITATCSSTPTRTRRPRSPSASGCSSCRRLLAGTTTTARRSRPAAASGRGARSRSRSPSRRAPRSASRTSAWRPPT